MPKVNIYEYGEREAIYQLILIHLSLLYFVCMYVHISFFSFLTHFRTLHYVLPCSFMLFYLSYMLPQCSFILFHLLDIRRHI